MTRKPDYKVPFSENGALLHYAIPQERRLTYRHPDQADTWRDPEPFRAELTIDHARSGRSAKYVIWTDPNGRLWPMFIAELLKLIKHGIAPGGVVLGWWIPCKRGQNFGLRYLGEEPKP
jgi:hypothetical protein